MNPTNELTVTYLQGNYLHQLCGFQLPEKFGDRKFTTTDRGTFDRNARQLYKAIKKVSPGFQKRPKMQPFFGDPENWREIQKKTVKMPAPNSATGFTEMPIPGQPDDQWEIIDPEKTITLKLNALAADAVTTMLYILSYADSPKRLSPAEQDEVVEPLAIALNCVPWLEIELGITKELTLKPKYDPPAAAAPATADPENK